MAIGVQRRLAKIEAGLGPKELVFRWLAEAHGYDDFFAYARSTYSMGPDGLPLDRLVHETIDWVEATTPGRASDDRSDARQRALRQVLFLFHLVLRTNVLAQEALDREVLLEALFSAHLGLAAIDTADGKRSAVPTHASRLDMVRTSVFTRVSELRAMEQARSQVEVKYLDGGAPPGHDPRLGGAGHTNRATRHDGRAPCGARRSSAFAERQFGRLRRTG